MTSRSQFLLAVLAAIIWFSLLGYRDLFEPDEGRYAEIPREMVTSGDWLTPRLNGFKYFEKPALQYWASAAGFVVFGESNATARLWPAIVGFLGALFIWFAGYRLYGRNAGYIGFILTLSGLFYVTLSHIITLDLAVSVFMVMGIGCLALAQSRRDDPAYVRRWMLLGWAALALATLTKGLIGLVLPAGAVFFYSLWQRDWVLWKHLHLGKGLLLILAITAPWFIAVSIKNPEFAHFFFIHEHLDRYLSPEGHDRSEPWWFFFANFFLGALPWFFIMLRSLVQPDFQWRGGSRNQFNSERFFWVFSVFVFVFFSFSSSKLPPYILPIFPVLALLAGKRLANENWDKWIRLDGLLMLLMAVGFLASIFMLPQAVTDAFERQVDLHLRPWFYAASALMLLGAIFFFRASRQKLHFLATSGLFVLLALQMLSWGFQALSPIKSSRLMADAIRPYLQADTKIYSVEIYYPQSLPFYLQRTITLVNYQGEMAMGIEQEPERWIKNTEIFKQQWRTTPHAIAVMSQGLYKKFKQQALPMQSIYETPKLIAVVKP
ncbi:MAG TPA: glycosyltransferase family 39 protein [Gammaproteobacteria bacterium]|nr:glycosyltransferase family 39 protein [Gammaproteobacteria bacterium]